MKKFAAVLISALILCSCAACSANDKKESEGSSASSSASRAEAASGAEKESKDSKSSSEEKSKESSNEDSKESREESRKSELSETEEEIKDTLGFYKFEGVFYAEKDGTPVASFAIGKGENGSDYTMETPMPVGSMSKQFCAAAILKLKDDGKLKLDDKLNKYFPEYADGEKLTLKNLLSMRSGIKNFPSDYFDHKVTPENTSEVNTGYIKEWLFKQELDFEPDSKFAYSNSNYFLLGNIVEQVSGKKYIDYLRESFFAPLGMEHTGNIEEMISGAAWTNGSSYKNVNLEPGLTKGAGDIITTAGDAAAWVKALFGGEVISEESLKEMTENYSGGEGYGFGLYTNFSGGIGHPGLIGSYTAADYYDPETKTVIFFSSSTLPPQSLTQMLNEVSNTVSE